MEWKRVRCRAIGNLAVANYQSALEMIENLSDDGSDIKQRTVETTIQGAIAQLNERMQLAEDICAEEKEKDGHGPNTRIGQAISWQSIALSRLSLCYTCLADLHPAERKVWIDLAIKTGERGVELALRSDNSAVSLSRLLYGRAILRAGRNNDALKQFNATTDYEGRQEEIATSAIALCMEPSTDHRRYLRGIIDVAVDLLAIDPNSGYTALDYVVFAKDTEAEAIVLDGLRKQVLAEAKTHAAANQMIEGFIQEVKLRKGYREIFQEGLRPVLYKYSNDRRHGSRKHSRHGTISRLRRIYAETLAADPDANRMFDHFKAIKYSEFVDFGRLPRSSDGLVQHLHLPLEPDTKNTDELQFVIFFSYRWINQDPSRDSPDDADHPQYRQMVEAVEAYLKFGECPVNNQDNVYIWMDFACVDQDNPSSGVSALPIIISQCDLVITLKDDEYYDRAWCCVEAMMIQTLRKEYGVHMWLEHVPLRPTGRT